MIKNNEVIYYIIDENNNFVYKDSICDFGKQIIYSAYKKFGWACRRYTTLSRVNQILQYLIDCNNRYNLGHTFRIVDEKQALEIENKYTEDEIDNDYVIHTNTYKNKQNHLIFQC